MAQSKITLIGFYNYYKAVDKDLFANLTLPAGISKDDVVNNILLKGGEFEVLFSNPDFLENMMVLWSNKNKWTFEKWIKAINIEYDPLYNYDRMEEYTDTHSEGETVNRSLSNAEDITKGENVTAMDHSNSTGNGETINTKSAYDSASYTPHDKSNSSSSGSNTSTSKTNVDGTQHNSSTGSDNSNKLSNGIIEHKAHLYGNIGVTTSQQMLKDELELAKWNLYDQIADLFIQEFCIYTY